MFRTLGKSKIAFVLAILFGISLFFFRGGSRYSNFLNSDSIIASVSGTPISNTRFNKVMQLNINQFSQMLGKPLSGKEIRDFQIHSIAINSLINETIFENEFDKINFKIDEKVIATKTKEKIPNLYDSNNQLDEEYLKNFLNEQRLKIEDLVQIISLDTRNKFFNEALFDINYPKYFSNIISNYDNQKRIISFIEFNLTKIKIDEIVDEFSSNLKNELKIYYENNLNNYMSEEKRDVEYIVIKKNSLNQIFNPSDFEINEYYNQNKELFFQNEERTFLQYNFRTKKEAENFKKNIENLNIEEIVEFSNVNNFAYNEFNNIKSNEILKEISAPLFSLNVNEHSDIIKTSMAHHIVILKSIKSSYQKKLTEVKNDIKLMITEIETNNYYNELLNNISEKILNGESLLNISNVYKLKIEKIDDLIRKYDKFDDSEKLFYGNLIKSTFASNKDFVSDVINVNENLSYIFNVTKITQPQPLEFENIEKIVLADWKNMKRVEKIKLDIEQNKTNKEYINIAAKKFDIKTNKMNLMKNSKELPSFLVNQIFGAQKNVNINSILNEKVFIAYIDDIIIEKNENTNKDISMLNDFRNSFGQELFKNKEIFTNDKLISALIDQY